MKFEDKEKGFSIEVIAKTPNPQTLIYQAMHQCYSSVIGEIPYSEQKCGEIAVKRLLQGNRGHFGCLEHPQISFCVEGYPHTVIQQVRTHRVGLSFDVQSFRYTNVENVTLKNIEKFAYIRPDGRYASRNGPYDYKGHEKQKDTVVSLISEYITLIKLGTDPEHAREILPYCIRQNFVMSGNLRSLLHMVDLRSKANTQLETVNFSDGMF